MQNILLSSANDKKVYYASTSKQRQLQYESDSWKRLIEFMMDENIHLKNRISDILKNGFDKSQLDAIEDFQDRLVKGDELITLLRNEVAELEKLLAREMFDDSEFPDAVHTKLATMRNNIAITEKKQAELKQAFNSYMLKIV